MYTQFDSVSGMATHDANGKELSAKAKKKADKVEYSMLLRCFDNGNCGNLDFEFGLCFWCLMFC